MPTPEPTPTGPPTEQELKGACAGMPVRGAAPYTGTWHPVVVVENLKEPYILGIHSSVAINKQWLNKTWKSGIELVICDDMYTDETDVAAGKCYGYKDSSGHSLNPPRYRKADTVRVIVAETGQTLQTKVIYGAIPSCGMFVFTINGVIYGDTPTLSQLNSYAVQVSKQRAE